ncbi:hypothetical protein bcgnr5388_31940 [Bacillus cereus]
MGHVFPYIVVHPDFQIVRNKVPSYGIPPFLLFVDALYHTIQISIDKEDYFDEINRKYRLKRGMINGDKTINYI